ncbi:hypothetical protein Q0M94_05905 [Deinococcus radiomollis]|uniref:hypothetical protein n=1 Tax=Deinococcus radiomollis TaxID=468916 RepID=UPI00389252F1
MRAEDSGTEAEDLNGPEEHNDLGTLFAAASRLNSDDLGAADRFLAGQAAAGRAAAGQKTVQPVPGRAAAGEGKHRHVFRVWASAALGLAAALGGLLVLRPAPTASPGELPASAAYSVYQSALGDGW